MSKQDVKERESFDAQEIETPKATMPPFDIVAYNEMRSCHDLWTMYDRKILVIDPDFQRHNVWSNKDRSLFIDSLLKGLPIPSICLFHDQATGKRYVVDGLQRISSVIALLGDHDKWTISNIEGVDERIRGLSVDDLKKEKRDVLYQIDESVLPLTIIRGDFSKKEHQDYLVQIFSRLNSGGKRLLNQEVRNCIFRGALNDHLKAFVRCCEWLDFTGMTIKKIDDDRFGQEERVLRIFAFNRCEEMYEKSLNGFLNDVMSRYKTIDDAEFEKFADRLKKAMKVFRMIPAECVRKNWNISEAVLIGIMHNQLSAEVAEPQTLQDRYNTFVVKVEAGGIREGLMQPKKVHNRLDLARELFCL